MNKLKRILSSILAIAVIITALPTITLGVYATDTYTTPTGYNDNDYQKAVAFLSQTKAIDQWDLEDPKTWLPYHADYSTFDPLTGDNILLGYSEASITWNGSNPKRITSFCYNGLDIPDSYLDLSDFTALEWLDCKDNKLIEIDVSGCTSLTTLQCHKNQLTNLDVTNLTSLESLDCSGNALTSIDVSKNSVLEWLDCNDNKLTMLDVSGTALKWLDCSGNALTNLDVSSRTNLESLDCRSNALTSIYVSKNTALETLFCEQNRLTSIDVSGLTSLKNLTCWENQLSSLNVTGCTALEWIDCTKNQLEGLDLSSCTALNDLSCWENRITDISSIENLQNLFYVDISRNNLDLGSMAIQSSIAKIQDIIDVNGGTFIYEPQNKIATGNVVLISITPPTAITGLTNGVEKTAAALGLPSTVTMITNDISVSANVVWDVSACTYNPATTTEQTFTVSGTVTLPNGVDNTNGVSLAVSISVTVNAATAPPSGGGMTTGGTDDSSSGSGGMSGGGGSTGGGGGSPSGGTSTSNTSDKPKTEKTTQSDGTAITTTTTTASDGTITKTETATRKGSKNQITIETTTAKGKSTTTVNVKVKDVKASVSTKTGLSTIKTDISADVSKAKSILSKRTADIKVVLDDNALLTRVNNNKVKNIRIDITGGSNSNVKGIVINKAVIEKARKLGKNIDVYVLDNNGKQRAKITVTADSKAKNVSLDALLNMGRAEKDVNIAKNLKGNNGILLTLGSSTPGSTKKQISLSGYLGNTSGIKAGQTVYVYKADSKGKLTLAGKTTISSKGVLTFNSGGNGKYVIVANKI